MVPTPIVIIEQAPETPAEIRQAALDGCLQGLGEGKCASKADSAGDAETSPNAHEARISWDSDFQEVRIVVELAPGQLERTIRFQDTDSASEKGAATGLVIATVIATRLSLSPSPAPRREPKPKPQRRSTTPLLPEPEPAEHASGQHPRLRTDFALRLGSGLQDGPLASGAVGRLSVGNWISPLFPLMGVSYARAPSAITSARLRVWLGVGFELKIADAPLALELSAAPSGELFMVRATQEDDVDRGRRFRFGGVAGADVVWHATRRVHPLFGGNISLSWPEVDIAEEGDLVGYQGVFGWAALAGIRFNL